MVSLIPQGPLELRTLEGREIVLTQVRIPADAIHQNADGKTLFTVEVTQEDGGSLHIVRRYAEFRELFVRLSRIPHDMGVAFPPKLLMACSGARLETRRAGLESWLNAVVFHSLSGHDDVWCGHLRDFLDADVPNFLDSQPNEALQVPSPTDFYDGPPSFDVVPSLQREHSSDSDLPFEEAGSCDQSYIISATEGESIDAAQIRNGARGVVKAWYGNKDELWSDQGKIVTEDVKRLLWAKRPLTADNTNFGDPLPNVTKALAVMVGPLPNVTKGLTLPSKAEYQRKLDSPSSEELPFVSAPSVPSP